MILLSSALAGAAVVVWRPPWSWVRVRVVGARVPRAGRREVLVLAVGVLAASLAALPPVPTILAWTLVAIAAAASVRWTRARERRRRETVRDASGTVVDGLVAELRSGVPPVVAVDRMATEAGALAGVVTAARAGGDVATALIAAGGRPGAEPLVAVGQAWAVSQACGVPLVNVLERVRASLREERALERELASGVAPARATALLMVAMPPMGLVLGSGLGVDPLRVVLTTVPGALCVCAGVAFAVAGVLWIDRIADRVEAGP